MSRTHPSSVVRSSQVRAAAREAVKRGQVSALRYLVYDKGLSQGQIAAYVGCDASRISRAMNEAEPDLLDSVHQWHLAQLASRFGCDDIANLHTAPGRAVQPLDDRINGCTDDEVIALSESVGRASALFREGNFRGAKLLFFDAIAAAQRGKAECMAKLGMICGVTTQGQAPEAAGSARAAAH